MKIIDVYSLYQFQFTVLHLCTELCDDNDCPFKTSFENLFYSFTENSASQKVIEITAGGNRSIVLYKEDQVQAYLNTVSNFTIVHITAGNIWIFHPAFSTPSSYIYISSVLSMLTQKLTCIAIIHLFQTFYNIYYIFIMHYMLYILCIIFCVECISIMLDDH